MLLKDLLKIMDKKDYIKILYIDRIYNYVVEDWKIYQVDAIYKPEGIIINIGADKDWDRDDGIISVVVRV